MTEVEVVVAHAQRATLRVGDVFLKVDPDAGRREREVAALVAAPLPVPRLLWHEPPVLALSAVPGSALGRLGAPSPASDAAWRAAGRACRVLHDAAPPPFSGPDLDETARVLDEQCRLLVDEHVLSGELVDANRRIAQLALSSWRPVFAHGDLQLVHVFVDGDAVSGVIDWSEAGVGDAHADLATLTLGHEEHLDHVLDGYGDDVDPAVIRSWWSLRSLVAVRPLLTMGFDPFSSGAEVEVLEAALRPPHG